MRKVPALLHSRSAIHAIMALSGTTLAVVTLSFAFIGQESATESGYVGSKTCTTCHFEVGREQAGSNFEGSWRPASALSEADFPKHAQEGDLRYSIEKAEEGWVYTVRMPGRPPQKFPVHSIIGGNRFGTSFILEVSHLESQPLPRTTLVEARFMVEAGSGRLKLSPGFPPERPANYETAVGRVLSRDFARNCMDCHGGIVASEVARQGGPHPEYLDTGVGCERCHGAGREHLRWLENEMVGSPGIVHPGKLSHPQVMELCGDCHSGFFPVVQPRPRDLLISNQVTALSNSECFVQSGAGLSCVTCHDGHGDARHDDPRYTQACLSCHDAEREIRVCPVDSADGCIDCHMPTNSNQDNFALTDHWIRVIEE